MATMQEIDANDAKVPVVVVEVSAAAIRLQSLYRL